MASPWPQRRGETVAWCDHRCVATVFSSQPGVECRLRDLLDASGGRFVRGVVLYTGDQVPCPQDQVPSVQYRCSLATASCLLIAATSVSASPTREISK